jgi:CubicO group peptidase (beta-lactamase class C family)
MAIIEGTCREEFRAVREVLEYNLDSGIDVGASVAVFIDGEPVVDLWGGYFDATYTRPWERDTIVQTFSTISLLIQGSPDDPSGNEFFVRALLNPRVTPQTTWSIPWRRAEVGGMNGHGNARGIAAAQSVLANGGAYGKRLLSDAGREQVLRNEVDGVGLVLGAPMRWGMGYALSSPTGMNFAPRSAYWAGNGGSLSYVDLDARMSVGFAMNRWVRGEHENDRSLDMITQPAPRSQSAVEQDHDHSCRAIGWRYPGGAVPTQRGPFTPTPVPRISVRHVHTLMIHETAEMIMKT